MTKTPDSLVFATGGLVSRYLAGGDMRTGFATFDLPEAAGCLDAPCLFHAGSMVAEPNAAEPARFNIVSRRAA